MTVAEGATGLEWQRRNAAVAIIGHQQTTARGIHRQMARRSSARGLLIEQGELAEFGVKAIRADTASLVAAEIVDFPRGIEHSLLWVDRKKSRIFRFCGQLRGTQAAGLGIEPGDVNAMALLAGVRADKGEPLVIRQRHAFGRGQGRQRTKQPHRRQNSSPLSTLHLSGSCRESFPGFPSGRHRPDSQPCFAARRPALSCPA